MDKVGTQARAINAGSAIHLLRSDVQRGHNDARWLRERQGEERLLAEVIRQAAWRFRGTATG
jgi:carboxylate-amine ligase